eukprot:1390517-Amorphochlora_amoeboformis.AAC.2
MEEAPAPTVRPDPYAVSLAKGDHPATFGIILTTLWRTAPSDVRKFAAGEPPRGGFKGYRRRLSVLLSLQRLALYGGVALEVYKR